MGCMLGLILAPVLLVCSTEPLCRPGILCATRAHVRRQADGSTNQQHALVISDPTGAHVFVRRPRRLSIPRELRVVACAHTSGCTPVHHPHPPLPPLPPQPPRRASQRRRLASQSRWSRTNNTNTNTSIRIRIWIQRTLAAGARRWVCWPAAPPPPPATWTGRRWATQPGRWARWVGGLL